MKYPFLTDNELILFDYLPSGSGQLMCFDFKYAVIRTAQNIDLERHSIKEWISKIDPKLIFKLESLL